MGAAQSQHLALYSKILKIKSPNVRVQMLQQILSGPEYVTAARQAGVYAALLEYIRRVSAGEPAMLPGERPQQTAQEQRAAIEAQVKAQVRALSAQGVNASDNNAIVSTDDTKRQRARDMFSMSLYLLGLEEADSLNEDTLKAAYKKAALKSHPDKGGNEESFKEVTRAFAYLSEILKRINGGRKVVEGKVEKPTVLATARAGEADKWKHIEPTRLNAKNLDMNAFNKLFETTRIPDPDEDGYGDWLKDAQTASDEKKKFSGEYNRDVFMRAFEDEVTKKAGGTQLSVIHPSAMAMTLQGGTELGRERPAEFTAAANDRVQYTDLKMAYTRDNTITNHVANVRVEARDYKQYKASREEAPKISAEERAALDQQEKEIQRREQLRQRRYAQEQVANSEYFERMKQLMIVDKGTE
jgi:curved DNA-binding protein CbpA